MPRKINRKDFIVKTITGLASVTMLEKFEYNTGFSKKPPREIGSTGIMVPPLCFGAPRTNDESLIRYAVDKGITFIDTGRSYGNGNNEKLVGRAVASFRDKVVIQSKIRLEKDEVPSGVKSRKSGEEIKAALGSKLEASLKALNTKYIDIMLIHDALDETLLFHPETLRFFEEKKKAGIIRAHGFSTHNDCMNLIERNNTGLFYDIIMLPFNHKGAYTHSVSGNYSEWDQNKLIGLLEKASEKKRGVIAMKTCSGGPYSPSAGVPTSFNAAVKWVTEHSFISSAAVAMASFEQVDEHLPILAG